MTEPAHTTRPSVRHSWHNALPAWILADPPYQQLPAQVRFTLQTIADRCDPPSGRGDLIGALGGNSLPKKCGVARCTFFRHVRRLVGLGYMLKLPGNGQCNSYAIPGACRAAASPAVDNSHVSHISQTEAPQIEAPGRLKLRRNHLLVYPPGLSPIGENGFSKKPRGGRITAARLGDNAAVLELHAGYVAAGRIDPGERGEQYVFEAAVNALRHGRTPGALFWRRIKDFRQRQLFPVPCDVEDAARARWKLAKTGERPGEPVSAMEELHLVGGGA
ncbi:MAG: hypothetical protein IID41_12210 [Planctomycetes bacterium]|nr:hypothetical protein [Planctomycetota bacterium]